MTSRPTPAQLPTDIEVVNVGLPLFADALRAQGRPVDQLDWRIPAGGDPELLAALTTLLGRHAARIDAANAEVFRRLDTGVPVWTGVATALDVLPDVGPRTLLHCGPAIEWPDVADPLRRSMRAATVAEGWAAGLKATINGMKNSFHIHTPLRMVTEMSPGLRSGSTTRRKICHSLAPSTCAALTRSRGRVAAMGVRISTPKGRPRAT